MTAKIHGILLDIEGTTSSIRFVYDVMFPYVRQHVGDYLKSNWSDPKVVDSVQMLAIDLGHTYTEDWFQAVDTADQQTRVVEGVVSLMDADVKATGLKQLQGLVWKSGFENGQLVAHLFDDVAPAIKKWSSIGMDVRIYSSGSIAAQKLFFGHTVAGDLLPCLNGHYDTTTGSKKEPSSYRKIADKFDIEANKILFVSDVVAELEAAKSANLQTCLSIRPGNAAIAENHGFDSISNFSEIEIS